MLPAEEDTTKEQGGEEGPLPWNRPGVVRRDCEPHRGTLLGMLGGLSFALGVLSPFTLGLTALPALVLGIVALWLARRDLARMAAGHMDPQGKGATEAGRDYGVAGILASVSGFTCCGLVWLSLLAGGSGP